MASPQKVMLHKLSQTQLQVNRSWSFHRPRKFLLDRRFWPKQKYCGLAAEFLGGREFCLTLPPFGAILKNIRCTRSKADASGVYSLFRLAQPAADRLGYFLLNFSAFAEATKQFKNQNGEINRQRKNFVNRHLSQPPLSIIPAVNRLSLEASPPCHGCNTYYTAILSV